MKRKRIVIGAAALAACAAGLAIFGRALLNDSLGPTPHDETARMVQRLKSLAASSESPDNPFASRAQADALRRKLDAASDPREQTVFRSLLGMELINAGDTEEALEELAIAADGLSRLVSPDAADARRTVRDLQAIGYLRLGEQENCIHDHNSDSCLLPIREGGVHQLTRGSATAYDRYAAILREEPENLSARWLLNIAAMTLGKYPDGVPHEWLIPPEVFASDADIGRFRDVATAAGVDVLGLAGGVVAEDIDLDGDIDIACSSWSLRDQLRLLVNRGDGTFTDMTEEYGLTGITGGLNLNHADYDNDGDPDLLVLRGGWQDQFGRQPNSLLRNDEGRGFSDVTESAGLLSFHPTQTAGWADFDLDGWLDVFIGNETMDPRFPHPCELYRNNADGTFTECAAVCGVAVTGLIKGVCWGDYDNDGRPDLYVSRMGATNLLLHNEPADGKSPARFRDVALEAGVTEPLQSFPVWFWDFDNDGWLDLCVWAFGWQDSPGDVAADYLGLPHGGAFPKLYRNNRMGAFDDVTSDAGLQTVLFAMGCNFGDVDNDGWLDCYIGTGEPDLGSLVPNRIFRNDHGVRFQDITTAAGIGHLQKGHGIAFADFDLDGDQDVYAVMGGWFPADTFVNALFVNPGQGNHWITLRLEGTRANRSAIGARVRVDVDTPSGPRHIHQVVSTGGSFGSNSLQLETGLGDGTRITAIEVVWPGTGVKQMYVGPDVDRSYRIREGDADLEHVPSKPFTFPTQAPADHDHEDHHIH